eukprot:175380-Chlamydomonas_euryale.AAC.2
MGEKSGKMGKEAGRSYSYQGGRQHATGKQGRSKAGPKSMPMLKISLQLFEFLNVCKQWYALMQIHEGGEKRGIACM